jgi:hypothetical protein
MKKKMEKKRKEIESEKTRFLEYIEKPTKQTQYRLLELGESNI